MTQSQPGDVRAPVDASSLSLRHAPAPAGGLLLRHLLLPGKGEETEKIIRFIADQISPNTWLNIMDQYRPAGDIRRSCPDEYADLLRRVSDEEVTRAIRIAKEMGLIRGLE